MGPIACPWSWMQDDSLSPHLLTCCLSRIFAAITHGGESRRCLWSLSPRHESKGAVRGQRLLHNVRFHHRDARCASRVATLTVSVRNGKLCSDEPHRCTVSVLKCRDRVVSQLVRGLQTRCFLVDSASTAIDSDSRMLECTLAQGPPPVR